MITLTRREALIRQLDTAISLWFAESDPVSIHLLTMASYQVLMDIGGDEKGPTGFKSVGYDKFFSLYEYLKHARADPNDIHDFPPRSSDFALWDCLGAFERLYSGLTTLMSVFAAHFTLHGVPEVPNLRENAGVFFPDGTDLEDAATLDRLTFLTKFAPMFADGKSRIPSLHLESP